MKARKQPQCFGSNAKKDKSVYNTSYIYIIFVYIYIYTVLGLGPREPPSWDVCCKAFILWEAGKIRGNCNSCMQKWSRCVFGTHFQNDMNLHFATVWEHCTTLHRTPFLLPHCLSLSLNLCRFASCQMTSTMAWNNIRVLTLPCCPSFWGASYLMKKLEKLSGFLERPKMRRKVGDVDFTGDTCRWKTPWCSGKKLPFIWVYSVFFFGKPLGFPSRWQFVRIQGAQRLFVNKASSCQIFDFLLTSISEPYSKGTCMYIYIQIYIYIWSHIT